LSVFAEGQSEAQTVSEQAAADALFAEGVRLRNSGDHAAACDRFQRSQAIDPALGTLQNIGMCLEEQDQLIAALGTFQQLLDKAEKARDRERVEVARSKIKALRKTVPKLQIIVPDESALAGLEIRVNGEPIVDALIGFPAPVDPGTYTVTARAPDRMRWSKTVELVSKRTTEVVVPLLPRRGQGDSDAADDDDEGDDDDVEGDNDVEGDDDDEGDDDFSPVAGRKLRLGVSGGLSHHAVSGLDIENGPAVAVDGAWRVTDRPPFVEVGAMLSMSSLAASDISTNGPHYETGLYTLLGTVSAIWPTSGRIRYRAQFGAGALVLTGLDDFGHPLLRLNTVSEGAVTLFQARVTAGVDIQVGQWTHLVINPLVAWYSPGISEFDTDINSLRGYQFMVGVAHLF
jgi:hypothetical protein